MEMDTSDIELFSGGPCLPGLRIFFRCLVGLGFGVSLPPSVAQAQSAVAQAVTSAFLADQEKDKIQG